MRRRHFAAFAPLCPRCVRAGAGSHALVLAQVAAEQDGDVLAGVLHCSRAACQMEYPIIDGIPVIVPDLRGQLAERATEWLLRDDLDPTLESLLGDAVGPGTWFDVLRQTISTYAWDGWADLDPAENSGDGLPPPGAARRCLERLATIAGPLAARRVVDCGCGGGRTSFALAERHPEALVLGIDVSPALLRLARGAMRGRVRYPRRRIGLVYDRRDFPVRPVGAERVDFWACDALALPFATGSADLAVALNLLDCVAEPLRLLAGLASLVRHGGQMLLATPYDWSSRATPLETWIGGHSQRGPLGGAGEPFLRNLLTEGAHPQAVPGVRLTAEDTDWPWHTRLHDRSSVLYRAHLLALAVTGTQER